jgi:hypothetical protein
MEKLKEVFEIPIIPYMTTKEIKLDTQTAPREPILMNMVRSFFIETDTKRKYSKMATCEQENFVGWKYGVTDGLTYSKFILKILLHITTSKGYKL